jgi:uncharacterized protein YdaU (DUF1376 family)
MNHYPRHIGDYAAATRHLSLLEHGVYCMLLDVYYQREQCLPPDLRDVQRLAGARSKEEREAVDSVLREFFILRDDGWHNQRCDEEIEMYQMGDSERQAKAQNEKERMRRHREERAALFEQLRSVGQIPAWDTPVTQLRALVERYCNAPATRTGGDLQREQDRSENAPETAILNHKPITKEEEKKASLRLASAFPPEKPPQQPAESIQPKAYVPPPCPHQRVLALWAEVLPELPRHDPQMWAGTRQAHLRARWRETAVAKQWPNEEAGLAYFRKLFAWLRKSRFLMGQAPPRYPNRKTFEAELEWLIRPTNWAKVHEGKYHEEAA